MSDKVYLGRFLADLDIGRKAARISRVNLVVNNETTYTAGDDTGRTIEKNVPWASQSMANDVLSAVKSVDYQPFFGTDALIDPSAEIGDGITVGGIYSVLAQKNITYGKMSTSNIAAPESDELDDEYPYINKKQRIDNRKQSQTYSYIDNTKSGLESDIARTESSLNSRITDTANGLQSQITQTAGSLESKITDTKNGLESQITQTASSINTRITDTANGLQSQITQTASSLTSQITDTKNGLQSQISQKVGSISMSVTNGATSSSISLYADGVLVKSENIQFTGVVTFNDLQGNKTIINGNVIDTGTLRLNSLYGNEIYLRDANGYWVGNFSLTGASSSYSLALNLYSSGALRLQASDGDLYLNSNGGHTTIDGLLGVTCGKNFYPNSNGSYTCGTSSFKWSDIYANNGTIVTSDLQVKHSVEYALDQYDAFFDKLRPMSFLFNDGTSGRRHTGLGAQDVERALRESGLTDMDFAGFIKSPKKTEHDDEVYITGYNYALRYEEFISLCIDQIQKLKSRVYDLERMIS